MTLTAASLRALFVSRGALLEGHFQLSSGLHSPNYMQCALLLSDPQVAQELGEALAALCAEKPDVVLSPALGGVVIGQEVARALRVRHFFLERVDAALTLRRGFALSSGQRFVVVEDVVTTGKSTKEVVAAASALGAKPAGVLSIVDRTGGRAGFDIPLRSLLKIDIPSYRPDACPLCEKGVPAVKPGSRPQPK